MVGAANRAAALLLRPADGELGGRVFLELVTSDLRARTGSALERALADGETAESESALTRSGERVRCRMLFVPVGGLEVPGALTILYDLRRERDGAQPRLTPRQSEVLVLLGAARTTSEIATELNLSRETVRNHVRAVLGALDARSRLEAVVVAERLGLLPPG
jgi:DNA-binding CsgD family transcriptional regulator